MKKILPWAAILGIIAAAIIGVAGSEEQRSRPRPTEGEPADQIVERFKLEGFSPDGSKAWVLTGDRAHVKSAGDVFIERHVVLSLEGGITVFAEKVLWKSERSEFFTRRPVKVAHEEVVIRGSGARGRLEDKMIQINRNIRVALERGTILTAQGPMKLYQNKDQVTLLRNVWILDAKGAVTARRMDGFFDPDEKKITAVVARGNVRISRGGDVTYSDMAVYDTRKGSVRLEGAPEVRISDAEWSEGQPSF
ncbi:MAG: LPS export ABC transporter periplasmic protein LptC [Candidatus Omnitrophica bacterium]|nr:LPS export ABC transporter periplasmic protein LptC [Candidatus Omnitrophota bacterium]